MFAAVKMAEMKFPMPTRGPAFGLFCRQQQGQIEMLLVVTMGKPDKVSVILKILSLPQAVVHRHVLRASEPGLQHIA